MHKFLAFLLTVSGSLLIMSSVSFAQNQGGQDDLPVDVVQAGSQPLPDLTDVKVDINTDDLDIKPVEPLKDKGQASFNSSKNVLPLGREGYDEIFTDNRAAEIVDFSTDETGKGIRRLFVKDSVNIFGRSTTRPSTLVVIANIIIGAIALLYLAINAANFITARGEEEELNKVKVNVGYIIIGLITVAAANILAFSVFNVETKDFLTGNEVSDSFNDLVLQAKTLVQYVIFAIAVISLIISGYELITRMGSEDSFTKEKEFIKHFLLAAGLIALAEVLVRGVFYARSAGGFDSDTAVKIGITEIIGLTNFLLGLVAACATFMLVLASFYYMLSFGDEERANRAKRIIISCIVGIIMAISAYTLVAYFIQI